MTLHLRLCLVLGACSEQEVLQYQGRPAATALECEAAFEAAEERGTYTPVVYNSRASVLGAIIGSSLAKGMTEAHFKSCLARVANLPAGAAAVSSPAPAGAVNAASANQVTARAAPRLPRTAGCVRGNGVMQGGVGYCVGN